MRKHQIESAVYEVATQVRAVEDSIEAALAERIGLAQAGTADRIRGALDAIGLPSAFPALEPGAVLAATKTDKKARAGRVEYALPAGIGAMAGESSAWGIPVDDEQVAAVLA